MERVTKSPFGRSTICAFTINSIRQVRFRIGHKLIDGIGDVIQLKRVAAAILRGTQNRKPSLA